ncbi:PspA/IM30 family protein [uncultured Nostoc sp.]|uniref:PspA/IM30 family protein n=1 Tax=uncultured Nostoc sp. TaxID=340711 RepID=UPI0035CB6313
MGLDDQTNSAQHALKKLRTATASASAAQKIAQRDYEQAQTEADKWVRRYQLALKEGREDLARHAQFQKERYQAIASRLKNLVDEQTPQVDNIKRNLASWESKISETQNEVLLSNPNTNIYMGVFERMEEKVLQIEASSKVVSQPNDFHEEILLNFEDTDEELKRLKDEISPQLKLQGQSTDKKDTKATLAEAICKTKEAVNTAVENKECIQKDYDKAQEEVKFWNRKAHIALKNNDDNLAIKAVLKKKVQNKIALTLQTQLQQQEATVAVLRQNLMTLENIKKTLGNDTKL